MGGPQRRWLAVARRLRPENVETVFLVPDGDDEFAEKVIDADFTVRRISQQRVRTPSAMRPNLRFLGTFPRVVRDVSKVISAEDIDLVQANMPLNLPVARAASKSESALLWHFNDMLVPWPINRLVGRMARRWSDQIAVTSRPVHDHFFDSSVRTSTLYPPVDIDEFDPKIIDLDERQFREELDISSDALVVGIIGNINPIKGHDVFLRSIAKLGVDRMDIDVIAVGATLDTQVRYKNRLLRLRSRLGLEDVVNFVGWRSDIPEIISLLDVFVCPSLSESGPMVVLEAMAMGCPVVTSNVGLVPEHFEDGKHAWIVEPGDSEALAVAISDALQSPSKRKIRAKRAQILVRDELSLNRSAESVREVYAEAMCGR